MGSGTHDGSGWIPGFGPHEAAGGEPGTPSGSGADGGPAPETQPLATPVAGDGQVYGAGQGGDAGWGVAGAGGTGHSGGPTGGATGGAPGAGAGASGAWPVPAPPRKRGRGRIVAWVLVVVVLIAGGATAAYNVPPIAIALGLRSDPRELATRAGTEYLAAWQKGDYAGMQAQVADAADDMSRVYGGMAQRLHITKIVAVPGRLDAAGTSMPYTATVTLQNLGEVTWSSKLHLVERDDDTWRVRFSADTVYPGLANGQRLELSQTAGERGSIVDRNGEPLSDDRDLTVNVVGRVGAKGAGATGLERAYDEELAGRPSSRLEIVDVATKKSVSTLQEWQAQPGKSVRTTFDLRMQRAAESALSGVNGRAALVAVDTQTGEVRALANHPVSGLAPAFASYYAPGSTFKIVTATAALMNGATPSTPIPCSEELTVNGKRFRNAEKAASRTLTFTEAFAESCNTAFIRLSQGLPAGSLRAAAELYGFNTGQPPLPIASVGGRIPAPAGSTEAAADAIGQGKVEASPLQMASIAAAVASGTWRQPHLLADCPTCASHPVPVASSLQLMMRAVVTSGTGTAAGSVVGGPVYGKTGTAEFGAGNPPATHAWFVGWQGTTAFAVFVEEGAYGGTVAAPIAARFLTSLGGG